MKSAFSIATLCAASSAVLIQSEPRVLDMANPFSEIEELSIAEPLPRLALDSLQVMAATPMCMAPPGEEPDCPAGNLYLSSG